MAAIAFDGSSAWLMLALACIAQHVSRRLRLWGWPIGSTSRGADDVRRTDNIAPYFWEAFLSCAEEKMTNTNNPSDFSLILHYIYKDWIIKDLTL